ncbi:TetR family transcriptional regulator [Terrilactibacillus sp. BCM23-1]|uniref:TetR family transcriptional regulator n=1 Tax=Terrilactibacillus tamarindi TaxID=2599694 RepID=A0A6N8CPW3_9BACI|nr:TetR/AcrR family transcriptional regulator [Terrilactibacillus tamarindi]MTT32224.1 TetR family transcriptional regulator [Terrilactibacillus tamarindi]
MNNKEIKKSRIWKLFVEATADVIQEEGVEKVTIRKVADKVGYNSATIYNYFSEASHLIFFACMTLLKDYTKDVAIYMQKADKPKEKYLLAWECICKHSFENPQIFYTIFMMDLGENLEHMLEHYYEKFPRDLIKVPDELVPILFERNIEKRGKSVLQMVLEEGGITEDKVDAINELTILIWQGMFSNILNHRKNIDPEKAMKKTMMYISEIVRHVDNFNF